MGLFTAIMVQLVLGRLALGRREPGPTSGRKMWGDLDAGPAWGEEWDSALKGLTHPQRDNPWPSGWNICPGSTQFYPSSPLGPQPFNFNMMDAKRGRSLYPRSPMFKQYPYQKRAIPAGVYMNSKKLWKR